MARPIKKGLDYFPFDVNLNDEVELLEAECGLEGFAILVKLWQKIYANGYYLDWSDDAATLFARKINSEETLVKSVINVCFHRNLLELSLYKQYGILTSYGIQKRYFAVISQAKRKLLSVYSEFILVNSELIPVNTELIRVSTSDKYTKKSKVKKSKEDNINTLSQNDNDEREDSKDLVSLIDIYGGMDQIDVSDLPKKYRDVIQVLSHWNQKKEFVTHKLTAEMQKAIQKGLSKFDSVEELTTAIDRYYIAFTDPQHFFKHKWRLDIFLKRSEGALAFKDEGQKWITYQEDLKKRSKQKPSPKQTTKEKMTTLSQDQEFNDWINGAQEVNHG